MTLDLEKGARQCCIKLIVIQGTFLNHVETKGGKKNLLQFTKKIIPTNIINIEAKKKEIREDQFCTQFELKTHLK